MNDETCSNKTHADDAWQEQSNAEAPRAPYDVIFFDMDGTLLPIEVRDFLLPYYELLEIAALRKGYDAQRLRESVNAGIFSMYDHPTTETNATAFWRVFFANYYGDKGPSVEEQQAIYAFMDEFYRNDFDRAGKGVVPNPSAAQALATLHEKGYPLYLTTMPMFPYSAIEWRMKWAGCDISLFDRVTTFENSTSVKPHLEYYRENIALADVEPGRILMVGNNTSDDLACLQCGMDAYLVTDYLINQNEFDITTVRHGSLSDFAEWVEDLPPCTSIHALSWRDRADDMHAGQ